jgi:hypothetical protein
MDTHTPQTDAFVDMILMGAKGHSSQELIDFARRIEVDMAQLREALESALHALETPGDFTKEELLHVQEDAIAALGAK